MPMPAPRVTSTGLPAIRRPRAVTVPKGGPGNGFSVRAPQFLIEYDNTQDDANHAHSVWRHLRDDWGADLLRDHYARLHTAVPGADGAEACPEDKTVSRGAARLSSHS